jgi:hypothetical protein
MCDKCSGRPAVDTPSICDLITLVAEDRAEIEPFRAVGRVAQCVTDKALAAHGWFVQLSLVERNSDDAAIKVSAAHALAKPNAETIRTLLRVARSTPWYPIVQYVLAELAIAHADTVFASSK